MRPLELDYSQPAGRSNLAVIVLAGFAAAFAVDSGIHYRALLANVAEKEVQLARAGAAPARPAEASPQSAPSPEELTVARETARRLSMPWTALFQALESAKTDRVALLAIEPDPQARTVVLSAEAKDYAAALAYVGKLSEQKGFDRVHLARHEIKQSGAQRPIAFTVSASWKGER